MSYELLAKFASLDEDEACLSFAFSADEFSAGKYVMFQHPLKADKQDRRLGLDGLYIECDDRLKSCYRGVESIRRVKDRIEIVLTEVDKQRLKVQQVSITPVPWGPIISDGLVRLAELSGGEYNVDYQ